MEGSETLIPVGGTGRSSSSLTWEADRFYHISVTRDNSTIKFYRDGVRIDEAGNSSGIVSGALILLSNFKWCPSFNGHIDEVTIWDRR